MFQRRKLKPAALTLLIGSLSPMGMTQSTISALKPYESCTFKDGLQIVELGELRPAVTQRKVETSKGNQWLTMSAGKRVMFGYLGKDFYANVKVEALPADTWAEQKQVLIDNLETINKSSPEFGALSESEMHGFQVRGSDRSKLNGGVLGLYLFFDDKAHVVTTLYLLNQEPQARSFQTMGEYAAKRASFLDRYTECVQQNEYLESLRK